MSEVSERVAIGIRVIDGRIDWWLKHRNPSDDTRDLAQARLVITNLEWARSLLEDVQRAIEQVGVEA